MNLSVVRPGGFVFSVSDLTPEAPLSLLKERVAGPSGVPVAQQVLVINEVVLKSIGDPTLESLGVKDGATLTLIQAECPLTGLWKGTGDERRTAMNLELDCGKMSWLAADIDLLSFKIKYVKARTGESVTEVYEGKFNAELGKIEAFGQHLELVDAIATPEELARVEELKSMPRSGLIACIHRFFDVDQDGRLKALELESALGPYRGDLEGIGVTVQLLCQACGWDETVGPNMEELTVAFGPGGPLAAFKDENLRGYIVQAESRDKPAYDRGFIVTGQLDLCTSGETVTVVYNNGETQIELHRV